MSLRTKIDRIDINIIRALQRNARTNLADIARDCDVSIDTISKRFKKMKSTGVVRGTTILLNPKSFGYDCVASLGIDVNYPHVKEIVEFVENMQDIVFCTRSMGKHDIFAISVLKNVGRLGQLKESIKGHPLVREVTISIWVDQILLCPENFEFSQLEKR
jgi:DNA-binding Lrp family transcriptional regulator